MARIHCPLHLWTRYVSTGGVNAEDDIGHSLNDMPNGVPRVASLSAWDRAEQRGMSRIFGRPPLRRYEEAEERGTHDENLTLQEEPRAQSTPVTTRPEPTAGD